MDGVLLVPPARLEACLPEHQPIRTIRPVSSATGMHSAKLSAYHTGPHSSSAVPPALGSLAHRPARGVAYPPQYDAQRGVEIIRFSDSERQGLQEMQLFFRLSAPCDVVLYVLPMERVACLVVYQCCLFAKPDDPAVAGEAPLTPRPAADFCSDGHEKACARVLPLSGSSKLQ